MGFGGLLLKTDLFFWLANLGRTAFAELFFQTGQMFVIFYAKMITADKCVFLIQFSDPKDDSKGHFNFFSLTKYN